MRETVIENDYVRYAEARGWLVRKMTYAGRRGCPDRWFFRAGKMIVVEFKKRGEKPDGVQTREHARLKVAGFNVLVIDEFTPEKAAALFA